MRRHQFGHILGRIGCREWTKAEQPDRVTDQRSLTGESDQSIAVLFADDSGSEEDE